MALLPEFLRFAAYRGLRPRTPKILGLPGPDPGFLRGLRPRTPGHFFDAEKVTKKAHKGGTLSMGSLPYGSLPHDDTKGGAGPPLETPAYPPVSLFAGGSASQGCGAGGESKEGAAAPSLVVAGGDS